MDIEHPINLVQLPRTLHDDYRPKFGHVYGLAGQKRKRHEICAAVDGDSLSIYEVGNGRVLSSYPVPPTSSFKCSPCSIRRRGSRDLFIRRTYCVVERIDTQIECFTEKFDKQGPPSTERTVSAIIDSNNPPVYLDIISDDIESKEARAGTKIILVQQNGITHLYSEDLSKTLWSGQLCYESGSDPISLCAVQHVDLQDARKSFLKDRQDIWPSVDSGTSFLASTFRVPGHLDKDVLKFAVWKIDKTMRSSETQLMPLIVHKLPSSDQWTTSEILKVRFGVRLSTISVACTKSVVSYDFSSFLPRVISKFTKEGRELSDAIQLNSSLIFTSTSKSVAICDTTYGTIQSKLDLETGRSRRRAGSSTRSGITELVTYFPRLDKVIALRGRRLVTFTLQGVPKAGTNYSILLLNSIGRGAAASANKHDRRTSSVDLDFGTLMGSTEVETESWSDTKELLKKFVRNKDVEGFESACGRVLRKYATDPSNIRYDTKLVLPISAYGVPHELVSFLISVLLKHISSISATSTEGHQTRHDVEVNFAAPHLISWLSRCGLFSRQIIQQSLVYTHTAKQDIQIEAGDLAEAFVHADSSLSLLSHYLAESRSLDIPEVIKIIKILLSRALSQAILQEKESLLSVKTSDQVEHDQPTSLLIQTSVGEDMQQQMPVLATLSANLAMALEHLSCFGTSNIISSLRTEFEQEEILALVQFLRQQLFRGGHTQSLQQKPYPSPPLSKNSLSEDSINLEKEDFLDLDPTVKLLSCCVDSIGPLASVSQGDRSEFIMQLIPELKAEVSLAMEALEETLYLQGLIRETVRYADSLQRLCPTKKLKRRLDGSVPAAQKPGTIVTLYSEPAIDQGDIDSISGLLPMSLRPEEVASRTKKRKGNGQIVERSAREIQEIQHRAKGRYSFEKLVL